MWREFYTAFCDRYGVGSLLPEPPVTASERDRKLLALAWHAAHSNGEIVLTEDTIADLAVGDPNADLRIAPHVELAARVHATSTDALERGEFTLTVAPARSVGTLTARFSTLTPDSGLAEGYASVPVATQGALPVQLSFPPVHSHAENVARVPAFLPHVLPLGEHRAPGENVIAVGDLAVTATRHGLHLVSISRRQVVEPQVFSALALDKQLPLARFLAHLSRALGAAWTEFDWGPQADLLPRLPRVRYRRSILAPARWRLTSTDLPAAGADPDRWTRLLGDWQAHWDLLRGVLDAPKAEAWSGVTVGGNESFDGVWLRLTATEPGTCFISAEQAAVDTGLCTPAIRFRSPALVEQDSLAYFALRRQANDGGPARFELGAIGHGPTGQQLADRISDQIRAWDTDRAALPAITAYPAGTPDDQLDARHKIDKRDSRLVTKQDRRRLPPSLQRSPRVGPPGPAWRCHSW